MKKIKALLLLLIACVVGLVILIGIKTAHKNSVAKSISKQIPTITQFPTTIQQQQFIIKGSIPYWDQDHAFSTFKKNVGLFSYINLFWYYVSNNGTIERYKDAYEDKNIINFAHTNNVKVFAVVTNLPDEPGTTWDSGRVEGVIRNKTTQDNHIRDIIKKITELDFDGVTIDYEEVRASQKDNFSSFIEELASALHKKGKIVAVALHAKTSDSDSGNGAFQDWEALARNADQLNIMAYGEHWDESSAGPIASIGWVKKIIEYSKRLDIPSEKFILGIPLYGYDWNKNDESKAKDLTYKDVRILLTEFGKEEHWSSESASPYFFYNDHGDTHEVWFENGQSVEEKIKIAKKAGFGGITFWRLGEEDPDIWKIIRSLR